MSDPKYPSPGLLKGFLARNSITQEAAGAAVGVTRITIWSWIHEESAPSSEELRRDIATWTKGEVPEDGWPPFKDRRKDPAKSIEPFEPAPVPADDAPPDSESKADAKIAGVA